MGGGQFFDREWQKTRFVRIPIKWRRPAVDAKLQWRAQSQKYFRAIRGSDNYSKPHGRSRTINNTLLI